MNRFDLNRLDGFFGGAIGNSCSNIWYILIYVLCSSNFERVEQNGV